MASRVGTWCLVLWAGLRALTGQVYNSSETCLMGVTASSDLSLDCSRQPVQGHIFVRRAFHGLTPTIMHCSRTASASSCCPAYNASRDCLFSTREGVDILRKKCNTYTGCDTTLTRATVGGACPAKDGGNLTYATYSYYGLVEYSCVNGGLMTDVCDTGTITRGRQRYLETNVFHKNPRAFNTTCACAVSTTCGQRLVFTALTLDLPVNKSTQQCLETVVLQDRRNSSLQTSIGCGFVKGGNSSTTQDDAGETKIFETVSNVADFRLELLDANVGTLLVRVTASENADVEIRCGRTVEQPLVGDHQCTEDLPTMTTSTVFATTSESPTSASTVSERQTSTTYMYTLRNDVGDVQHFASSNNLSAGAIAGAAVAVAVVIVILLLFFLLLCKIRTKRQQERAQGPTTLHVYYTAQYTPPFLPLEAEREVYTLPEQQTSCEKTPFPEAPVSSLNPVYHAVLNSYTSRVGERPEISAANDNIVNEDTEVERFSLHNS